MKRSRSRGAALVEWLVAAPVVLLLGLSALQWALLLQARHALDFAAQQAIRHAALGNGHADAVNAGLATGLHAFWLTASRSSARTRLDNGFRARWIHWRRTLPSPEVFADFGEPAMTPAGDRIVGDEEIPNDNLRYRQAAPGPISRASVQDANRFRLELHYAVPLRVPIIGALTARVMEMASGCATRTPSHLVLTRFDKPRGLRTSAPPQRLTCAMYRAPEEPGGTPRWRLPVRVTAQGWMQSPLRASAATDSSDRAR